MHVGARSKELLRPSVPCNDQAPQDCLASTVAVSNISRPAESAPNQALEIEQSNPANLKTTDLDFRTVLLINGCSKLHRISILSAQGAKLVLGLWAGFSRCHGKSWSSNKAQRRSQFSIKVLDRVGHLKRNSTRPGCRRAISHHFSGND